MLLLPLLLAGIAVEPLPQARPRRLREDEGAWEERGNPCPPDLHPDAPRPFPDEWEEAARLTRERQAAEARAEEQRVTLAKARAQAKRDRKAAARLRVGPTTRQLSQAGGDPPSPPEPPDDNP